MSALLGRLGGFCARHRWIVLGVWLLVVVAHILALRAFGDTTRNDQSLPGTDSQRATDLLAERFPPQQNGKSPIVFHVHRASSTTARRRRPSRRPPRRSRSCRTWSARRAPSASRARRGSRRTRRPRSSRCCCASAPATSTESEARSVLDAAEPRREGHGMEVAAGGSIGSSCRSRRPRAASWSGIVAAMIILTFAFGTPRRDGHAHHHGRHRAAGPLGIVPDRALRGLPDIGPPSRP